MIQKQNIATRHTFCGAITLLQRKLNDHVNLQKCLYELGLFALGLLFGIINSYKPRNHTMNWCSKSIGSYFHKVIFK